MKKDDITLGDGHKILYIGHVSYKYILETYIHSLINLI